MKRIPVRGSDRPALIDDQDFALVDAYAWKAQQTPGNPIVYAYSVGKVDGRCIPMHTLILGHLPGFVGDHINFDGLDNQRRNLRVVTQQHNSIHRRLGKNNTSGFRGVSLAERGRWAAAITHSGKYRFLGTFDTAEEAARAFDAAALELRGRSAELNFPGQLISFPVRSRKVAA